ncbi:MAG: S46 family peptidase [Planctomycetaceae bacterium]|nr:S46 family peptidase [Planctomycetaceae bacterium]
MRCRPMSLALSFLVASLLVPAVQLQADEGMWLFNQPPRKELKERYNFDATDAWLAHLRKSAVRFNNGGSGSFVSADGLVMTNHHIGQGTLNDLSTKDRDLLKNGYYARSQAEELKAPNLELNVLMSIEDVTGRVNAAVNSKDPAKAEQQRRAEMTKIEDESNKQTGLRSDVVTLYRGGLYQLYRYKKYTDVRLVFAPEDDIAAFGGDPDNFEYPRFDLDVCFFRVYENDKPVHVTDYLTWNPASLKEGDLVFVAGHPGRTERTLTVRHLEFMRDVQMPATLDHLRRQDVVALTFGGRSAENMRRAKSVLLRVQNSMKARLGGLAGLQDPAVMAVKRAEEETLRKAAAANPAMAAEFDAAMKTIDKSLVALDKVRVEYNLLEQAQAFRSTTFGIARTLVRAADEKAKPSADRFREFRDSNLDSLEQGLFSKAPIYADLETVALSDSLSMFMEQRGYNDPVVRTVMNGKSPSARAIELVRGTKLADVAVRRQLYEGGKKAIDASDDPMIVLARLVDKPSRDVRTIFEQQVDEPQRVGYGKLANIRFELFGKNTYPDATFTLRLAFGTVARCEEAGVPAPAWTTFGGLFERAKEHDNAKPFSLPKSWIDHKGDLDMDTPMNFVSTDDIIGGNSGSPIVNSNGELVGIIFDGDLTSLVWDYVYTKEGRAISVHGSAILEALRKVYDAAPLADELMRK